MTEEKKEYEVIRRHAMSYKVGQTVELTEKQALNLVNKVRLKSDRTNEGPNKEAEALRAENSDLIATNEALEKRIQELSKPVDNTSKKTSGSK